MYNCMELLGHISLEKLHDDIAFFLDLRLCRRSPWIHPLKLLKRSCSGFALFSIFCMKLGFNKHKKVTKPFEKNSYFAQNEVSGLGHCTLFGQNSYCAQSERNGSFLCPKSALWIVRLQTLKGGVKWLFLLLRKILIMLKMG